MLCLLLSMGVCSCCCCCKFDTWRAMYLPLFSTPQSPRPRPRRRGRWVIWRLAHMLFWCFACYGYDAVGHITWRAMLALARASPFAFFLRFLYDDRRRGVQCLRSHAHRVVYLCFWFVACWHLACMPCLRSHARLVNSSYNCYYCYYYLDGNVKPLAHAIG